MSLLTYRAYRQLLGKFHCTAIPIAGINPAMADIQADKQK